jgi:hypothetical protein
MAPLLSPLTPNLRRRENGRRRLTEVQAAAALPATLAIHEMDGSQEF